MKENGQRDSSSTGDLNILDGDWWTTDRHVYIYAGLIGFLVFFMISRSFAFYRMCLRISLTLHDMLYQGVTRTKMLFFHQNATGRILNRFSKDIGNIDSALPVIVVDCIEVIFSFSWSCQEY